MTPVALADEWAAAAAAVTGELSESMLGLGEHEVLGPVERPDRELCGAYLPMHTTEGALYVGILSDTSGIRALANALLGEDLDAEIAEPELIDAVGEVANIVGGQMKSQVPNGGTAQLGLPIFAWKPVETPSGAQQRALRLRLGSVNATIVVVSPAPSTLFKKE
ncbi:MAG TPA: chemotaxis protein CheX [Candidatus Binatia bacterium]|nr:chemotaxis protein CheX [Candidatus Binatia bacterium]